MQRLYDLLRDVVTRVAGVVQDRPSFLRDESNVTP